MSPVTGGVNSDGKLVVSTYPSRDKVHNIRRNPQVTVCVMSDHFGGTWVQVDGSATVSICPRPWMVSSIISGRSPASTPSGTSTGRRWSVRASA
jgi:hypothetical protein